MTTSCKLAARRTSCCTICCYCKLFILTVVCSGIIRTRLTLTSVSLQVLVEVWSLLDIGCDDDDDDVIVVVVVVIVIVIVADDDDDVHPILCSSHLCEVLQSGKFGFGRMCRWESGPIFKPIFHEKVTHFYTNRPDFLLNFDQNYLILAQIWENFEKWTHFYTRFCI